MAVRVEMAYSYEVRARINPLTLQAYSLPWQFDGRRAYMHLCGSSIAVVEPADGFLRVDVYAADGERCWEEVLEGGWAPAVDGSGLEAYYDRAAGDPLLSCIGGRLRLLTVKLASAWYAAIVAVCQQNASFLQGWRMVYRLHAELGARFRIGDRLFVAPPEPDRVSVEALRRVGLGYRAETLAALAKFARRGIDLREARGTVKGVGPYTDGLIRLLGYGELDSHVVDRWVKGLVAEAYGVGLREAEKVWSARWRPWRGLAAYHLTIVLDAEPLRKSLERVRRGEVCPRMDYSRPSPLTMWRAFPGLSG